nr:hypothetical protein [Tanacetum cinerariifolium]
EAPPSPDYIPGPEAPPSPDYIPGPEYLDYLPLADDMFPAEDQPLPAAVSPTAEKARLQLHHHHLYIVLLLGYLFDHIYLCHSLRSQGLRDYLSYLHTTISSFIYIISITTISYAITIFTPLPPPPPIILPHTIASMVLMRSATPSTFILAPLSRTPPIGTPLLLPIPLPTSSLPLPLLLPSTSCREGIPEADMLLQKRASFTTPTGGYEVDESSVAAARQIRPALTIDDSRRAEDRLIGRLRRERRYFRTLSTTYA